MDISNNSPDIVRQLADGTYAFGYRVGGTLIKLLVGPASYDEELSVIKLTQRSQAVLVHRSFKGAVRVFSGGGIRLFRNGEWLYRPYAFAIGLGVWKFA